MPYTKAQQNEIFLNMTGSTKDDLDRDIKKAIDSYPTTALKLAVSILSDAQEELAMGFKVGANRKINVAKYLIDGYGKED